MDEVYLFIITKKGDITIPFRGLIEADMFTVRFNDFRQLSEFFIGALDLQIDPRDISDMYITVYNRKDLRNKKDYSIRYKNDYYDTDELMIALSEYLKKSPDMINQFDIKFVKTIGMMDYLKYGVLPTNSDIDEAAHAFFKNASYKRLRDTYFKLKNAKVIGSKKLPLKDEYIVDIDLAKFETDDEYLGYLLSLARRNDEYSDEAMEYIAAHNLEDLTTKIKNPYNKGIVDGSSKGYMSFSSGDIDAFETLSGIGIENMKIIVSAFKDGYQRRKTR